MKEAINSTVEQQARDMLERMGVEGAQAMTSGDVVELANMIGETERLRHLLDYALQAICFTRDYVGPDLLPAKPGWTWYDVGKVIAATIPNREWAQQFELRVSEDKRPRQDVPVVQSDD